MKSRITKRFRKAFSKLPDPLKRQTRQAYRLFLENPRHPSLRFKQVHSVLPVYSARVSLVYPVVGVLKDDTVIWFWVGIHAEYEKLLKNIRSGLTRP